MGLMVFGILLVVIGLILAFTNALGLAELAQPFVWLGWLSVAIGFVVALISAFGRRREVVVEREYRRPPA